MTVRYFQRYLTGGKRVNFMTSYKTPDEAPIWFIRHNFANPPENAADIIDRFGNRYRLMKTLPYADLSGWNWYLYKKAGLTTPPQVARP
jgi:hypothetical protein